MLPVQNVYAQKNFLDDVSKVDRFFVQANGLAFVGLDRNLPKNLSGFYKYQFSFYSTTEAGKNMLSVMMAAQVSGSTVNVWYFSSVAEPGTDHTNGCGACNIAVLYAIGLRNS